MWRPLSWCLVLLLLSGCASTAPPLVVSGEALKAVGLQFVATSTAVTKACVAKQLTLTQCDSYRGFAQKFKAAFPSAVVVQETAMTFGDRTLAENAAVIVAQLVAELGTFTALLGGK